MNAVSLLSRFARAVSILLLPLVAGALLAAEQNYDYDPLGRLVRASAGGNSVEYRYDAAGNLLEVTGNLPVTAPAVSSVTPAALRRGQSALITLSGAGLAFSSVVSPAATLTVSGVSAQPALLVFNLAVAAAAPLGAHTFTVANSAGSANFVFTVNPRLPVLSVAPLPLAVAPDNVPRSFSIALSNADSIAHTVNLATTNTAIARVSPASLSIVPGQTSALASITGVSAGSTTLSLTSPSLPAVAAPVFVTAEFAGINTSHAPLLGVVLQQPPAPPPSQTIQLGARADVGVVVGGHLRDIAPKAVPRGASVTLTLFGKGLETATSASLQPADGVTLGSLSAAPDGFSATLPVTVAENAPATLRQIALTDAAGNRFPTARADSDRLLIAYPAPVVESITPVFGTVGAPVGVTLRGRNLQQGKVQLSPGAGIQVDGSPVVSADGTAMAFNLGIGSLTALGEHLVTVSTPGGVSGNVKGPENTFIVVTALNETIAPIAAPQLGVVLQAAALPSSQAIGVEASHVGIAVGPVVTGLSPRAGIVGETASLGLQGQELTEVTALTFTPVDGITVQSLTTAADGKSVAASVAIAANAPKMMRTVKAWAGATGIPFSDVRQSQFQVTAPIPRINSVTPVNIAVGTGPVTLTLRGVNFRDASLVSVLPANGITLSQPPAVNVDATEISVDATVAAAAATGQRVLTVTTPAGTTEATATPANTLNIVNTLGEAVTPIQAPVLGVVKLDDTPPPAIDSLLAAPDVGVLLQTEPVPPATRDILLGNTQLGVVVGAAAMAVQATPLSPGVSGTLSVSGIGLAAVASVSASPATGITLGVPVISADGAELNLGLHVSASAVLGGRVIRVQTPGGITTDQAEPANTFWVYPP